MLNLVKSILLFIILSLIGTALAQDAFVPTNRYGLRIRETPVSGTIIGYLDAETPLQIVGKLADGSWVNIIEPDGKQGWVLTEYLDLRVNIADIPVLSGDVVPQPPEPETNTEELPAELSTNAVVANIAALRLRSEPTTDSRTILNLPGNTRLLVIGQNEDSSWLHVQTEGGNIGWVSAPYVEITGPIPDTAPPPQPSEIPQEPEVVEEAPEPAPINFDGVISNITPRAWEIYYHGLTLGKRNNVFSNIGDSMTVSTNYLKPIGRGLQNLGAYAYLQPVIDYFSYERARDDQTSFQYNSLAMGVGWSTAHVLDSGYAHSWYCELGESPLVCEYRITKPAIAVILLGSNDATWMTAQTFYNNLNTIVDISAENGVIPVLCSIPPQPAVQQQVDEFNRLIQTVANEKGVPFCDYGGWMRSAPRGGLSNDGLHPSSSSRYSDNANFTGASLNYGYTLRNIVTLHVLDALWRQVIGA